MASISDTKGTRAMVEGNKKKFQEDMTGENAKPVLKKDAPGALVNMVSAMMQWNPRSLFNKKNEKFEEKSSAIDMELDKLLAESAIEDPAMIAGKDDLSMGAIKVEKLELPKDGAPNWEEIVPRKEPEAYDVQAMAPRMTAIQVKPGLTMEAFPVSAKISDDRLNINSMPIWGHTGLGKPLGDYKSSRAQKAVPDQAAVRSSMDLQSNSMRVEATVPVAMPPAQDSSAMIKTEPVPVTVKVAENKKPGRIDIGDDILKEIEEEQPANNDVALDIMRDLKGQEIETGDL